MWLEDQEAGTGLFCRLCAPAEGARVLFCVSSSGQNELLLLVTSTSLGHHPWFYPQALAIQSPSLVNSS